jgi:hypothetical protein
MCKVRQIFKSIITPFSIDIAKIESFLMALKHGQHTMVSQLYRIRRDDLLQV